VARIPEEELRRLKREVDLVRLVRRRGVILKPHGEDLIGLCPFHDDTEPSLVVSPGKNLWHCLGACGEGGSVVDWVMKSEGISFRHAVEILREAGPAAPDLAIGSVPKRSTARKLAAPVAFDASDHELLEQVVAYYQETLLASPEALEYLDSRGLEDPELISRFRLGFANRTLGLRLPDKGRKRGREIRGRLQRLGVFRKTGHEHFNGSLVVPVLDAAGHVAELYGRKINDDLRKGTARHLYLPGPHRGVFNLSGLEGEGEVILCESLLDALTFWRWGFPNVTAAYGVNGFTEEHRQALREQGVRRVLVAYDRDEAGDKAAGALAEQLAREGLGVFRVQFPRGMDANEYAGSTQPAAKALGLVLRSAAWMAGPTERVAGRPAPAPEARERRSRPAKPTPAQAAKEERDDATSPPVAAGRGEAEPTVPRLTPPPERRERRSRAAEASGAPAEPAEPAAPLAIPLQIPVQIKEPPPVELPEPGTPVDRAFGDRRYRVRGWEENLSYERLKVLVRVARGDVFFVDSVDLVSAKKRRAFLQQAAVELGVKESVVKADLARLHGELEVFQDALIRRELAPEGDGPAALTPEEEREALELLRDPELLDRIVADFHRAGIVGEETNTLTGYLAATSRKLDEPLAVIVQSASAAGKSSLLDAILALVPPEERVAYSAMTGQSLFYMGETDLAHKVLAVAEEEGAERAAYALKLLQSEGELTIASTGKDPKSGRLVTHEYRVEGPVAIFLTTTAAEVDEELLNRCLVLSVSESREQTRAIHQVQRERRTLQGLAARREREAVLRRHRNAQRLLRPLAVVNPYASELTFLDTRTRTRRDHEKYLTLIDTIALLHQHQREVRHHGDLRYVEVELADVEAANRLAAEVLGTSLDELPPQTRRLLSLLDGYVTERCEVLGMAREDVRFTRREVREALSWSDTQLKVHLARLADLEYLAVHPLPGRGGRYGYELVYRGEGDAGERFLLGLLDVERLRASGYDPNRSGSPAKRSGSDSNRSGSGRPPVGGRSGGGPGRKSSAKPSEQGTSETAPMRGAENASKRTTSSARPYPEKLAARGAP
jgi:DNA primase catalytic core